MNKFEEKKLIKNRMIFNIHESNILTSSSKIKKGYIMFRITAIAGLMDIEIHANSTCSLMKNTV